MINNVTLLDDHPEAYPSPEEQEQLCQSSLDLKFGNDIRGVFQ